MLTALSIAGSDPTGGAGLQLDLQVFRLHGLHAAGVPTALTIQDSERVHQVLPVFPSIVLDQIRVVLADFQPAVVKLGMLASDDVLRNVAHALALLEPEVPLVIDPVLASSSGTPLLERRAWRGLLQLFERASLVTPNLQEAELLSGQEVGTRAASEGAARALIEEFGAGAVLIKGGHRAGAPNDLLAVAGSPPAFHWLEGDRIDGPRVHGTGCALAASIAARLARGDDMVTAVRGAREFVRRGLREAKPVGRGAHFLGLSEADQ